MSYSRSGSNITECAIYNEFLVLFVEGVTGGQNEITVEGSAESIESVKCVDQISKHCILPIIEYR